MLHMDEDIYFAEGFLCKLLQKKIRSNLLLIVEVIWIILDLL